MNLPPDLVARSSCFPGSSMRDGVHPSRDEQVEPLKCAA